MDRIDISRLNKNRGTFLQIGFVAALSLTVMAFNYTVYDDYDNNYETIVPMEEDILEEVQRTVHKEKKMPPPPVMEPTDNFVPDDNIVFDPVPEPEPLDPKIDIDPKPIEPSPRPVISRPPAPTVAPEPEPIVDVPDIFMVVEKMPRFVGCEGETSMNDDEKRQCADKKMLEYIYSKIEYPSIAEENQIEGVVVVSFVIETDGSITAPKVTRGIGGGCGKEVLRVVKGMPNWIAGEQRGRKVRVQFNLPVKFRLY